MNHINASICARCSTVLQPGKDNFFEVRIEAVADRGTPDLNDLVDDDTDPQQAYLDLVRKLEDVSAQEATDQIARTLAIHLCEHCYLVWIENPCGAINH